MAGRKNVLSELQAQKIRENYKPGDSITKIAEKYRVHYKTIKNILGDLYMPSKAAYNSDSLDKNWNNLKEAIGSRIGEMCKGRIIEFEGKELNHRMR